MSVNQTLQGLGSWELTLSSRTPERIRSQVGFLGHVVLVDGPVDVEAAGNGILPAARYVGVCRGWGKGGELTREGSGLLFWLGDEDGKGHTLLSEVVLTNATLAQVVTALMPPTVTVGTVHPQANPATRYTGTHVFQSRREALAVALTPFDAEIRVRPDFTVDVGTAAQLYNTESPDRIIVRRGSGSDIDLTAVGGEVEVDEGGWDYSTDVTLLGRTVGTADVPEELFVTGSAAAPSVPWLDPRGNQVKFTRLISESGETEGSVAARTQLQLNRFNRTARSVKVTADDFVSKGTFAVGDTVYVHDPDTGIVNPAVEVTFQGQVLHPDVVRVVEDTWPITDGMTVAWRTHDGVWLDLTPWVVWETPGSGELIVGDLPKSTLGSSGNPVQDRVDAARGDTRTPKTPTGLTLSTSSSIAPGGGDSSTISADWLPVTQNTDNTTVSLSHYEVQWRPSFRAPAWVASSVTSDTDVDLAPVVPALAYDVHVRAWSTSGKPSDWSTTESIIAAADSVAPPATADPQLTNVLNVIRVFYPGTNSVGGPMPADTNRVDVEVGPSASGPWTVESSLNPFVEGVHYVTAPYSVTQHVRLVPYDHTGNAGPASAAVSAATAQLGNADIASLSVAKLTAGILSADVVMGGRFATALTGARVEMNSLGFQKYDASSNLLVSITGTTALLTGTYKTALTGRRIEIGSGGAVGEVNFYAPDGTRSVLRGWSSSGIEAAQLSIPVTGALHGAWNSVQVQGNQFIYLTTKKVVSVFGGATANDGVFSVAYASDTSFLNQATRFYVDRDTTTSYVLPAGNFVVRDDNLGTGYPIRVRIEGDGNNYFYSNDGEGTYFLERLADGAAHTRFYFDDLDFAFRYPSVNQRAYFGYTPSGNGSLVFHLLSNTNYGVSMFYNANDGAGANHRIEFMDASKVTHTNLWAASFFVASSGVNKSDVRPLEAGALRKLRDGVAVTRFRRRGPKPSAQAGLVTAPPELRAVGKPQPDVAVVEPDDVLEVGQPVGPAFADRDEIGVIAEDLLPELVVTPEGGRPPVVDLPSSVWLIAAAVQELAASVDELRGRAA